MTFTGKITKHYQGNSSFHDLLIRIRQIETLAVSDTSRILPTDLLKKVAEIFSTLNLKFAIAGGFAYAAHAVPRATEDIDILIFTKDLNTVKKALDKEGFVHTDILEYQKPTRTIIKYEFKGRDLDILDYQKYPDFVDFLLKTSITKTVSDLSYHYLGLEGLILTKLCSFRFKDKSDIVYLKDKNPDLDLIKQWCSYLHIMDRFSFMTEDHSKEK